MTDTGTAEAVNTSDRWLGVTVLNGDVAATIRKYGACAHSKPHGPGKMILYYENPNFNSGSTDEGRVVDYAGTITPGTRTIVQNEPVAASLNHGASIQGRNLVAGAPPQVGIGNQNVYQNPNNVTRGDTTSIANPEMLDSSVEDAELRNISDRENRTARDKMMGENRSDVTGALSATPFMGPTTPTTTRGAPSIPALTPVQAASVRQGLQSEDPEVRAQAADVVLGLVEMLPIGPADSEAGTEEFEAELRGGPKDTAVNVTDLEDLSDSTPQLEPTETGGTSLGGNVKEPEEPDGGLLSTIKDAASSAVQTVVQAVSGSEKGPEEKLKDAHPEWDYAFLSAKTKSELEDLADEAEKVGVTVSRTDGSQGPLRKEDYITALRTDK